MCILKSDDFTSRQISWQTPTKLFRKFPSKSRKGKIFYVMKIFTVRSSLFTCEIFVLGNFLTCIKLASRKKFAFSKQKFGTYLRSKIFPQNSRFSVEIFKFFWIHYLAALETSSKMAKGRPCHLQTKLMSTYTN